MRLKSIALLVVAMLLLVGSAAGMAAAGAGDRSSDEGWRMNARYWWEDGLECLPPYQRKQVRDIMVLILDAYFGIDISRMSLEELDEVGSLIGNVGQEKVRSLFEHYAHKKGFEMPEPPEPSAPLPIEPVYWWEITCPQGALRAIIYQVAQAKGKGMCRNEVEEMCPSEVEERFGELFPDMDIWNMTFDEFILFLNSLPRVRAPLRPVCFEELQHNPRIIALFGRVPPLSTEEELEKFNEKLNAVIEEARPLLDKLPWHEFPLGTIIALHGAISISVRSDQLPRAEVVYEILAEKAESLFGIKDVPVTFNNATDAGPAADMDAGPQGSLSGSASSGWRPPFNEPFNPIPGAVKVTPRHRPQVYTTASFAVAPCPLFWWEDADYIITGHKGRTITPVNMHIYQPTRAYQCGYCDGSGNTL